MFNWIKKHFEQEDQTQKALRLLTKAAKNGDKRAKKLISLYDSINKQESIFPIRNIINNQNNKLTKIINK